jgi:hypothetical protein
MVSTTMSAGALKLALRNEAEADQCAAKARAYGGSIGAYYRLRANDAHEQAEILFAFAAWLETKGL